MKLLLALLLLPGAAGAQEFMVGDDILRMYARPLRDRSMRFQSARADALQMRLSTDDESDRLTLENWGDNRADLRAGESRLKVDAGAAAGESYSGGNKWNDIGGNAGAYGRFGRFEFEVSGVLQESERDNAAVRNEYHKGAAGAALAFGGDALSLGLHANLNKWGDEGEEVSSNDALGLALATRGDLFEFGVTLDYVGRGTLDESASYDVPREGGLFGLQALLKPAPGTKLGLRGAVGRLTAEGAHNGGTAYEGYKADHNELGARLEWRPEKGLFALGAEYSRFFYDPNWTQAGVFKKNESDYQSVSVGGALRLLGDRLLLGAEVKDLTLSSKRYSGATLNSDENKARAVTGGAELWLLPGLALRGSYQAMTIDDGSSETGANTLAAGFGLKGETFFLDGTVRSNVQDEEAVNPDKYADARLTLGWKF